MKAYKVKSRIRLISLYDLSTISTSNSHLIPFTTCNKWQTIELPSTFTSLIPREVAAGVATGSLASQRDFPSVGVSFLLLLFVPLSTQQVAVLDVALWHMPRADTAKIKIRLRCKLIGYLGVYGRRRPGGNNKLSVEIEFYA